MIISVMCNNSVVHTNKLPCKNISTDEYGSSLLYGSPTSHHLFGNCKNQGFAAYEMKYQTMSYDVQ